MEKSKKVLDDCVYGLNDKMQIMQMIGGWITNPNAVGTAIAIQSNGYRQNNSCERRY